MGGGLPVVNRPRPQMPRPMGAGAAIIGGSFSGNTATVY